ncbi:MAG: alpha-amylase, partial [Bdellovibrionales bacterium]|nr:alpha-amylase [Bdellovibrionales bacterium]
LESRGGTEAEFRKMVDRCRAAGVDVYADVVINHMQAQDAGVGFGGTPFGKRNHPGLFGPADFHACGRNGNNWIQNFYDRWELQNCDLLGLPDLATESPSVQEKLAGYITRLAEAGVAGVRMDAAKHVPGDDLAAILRKSHGMRYVMHELLINDERTVRFSEYERTGDVMVFPYSFDLASAIRNEKFGDFFRNLMGYPWSQNAVVFVDNHDLERFRDRSNVLSVGDDGALYRLATVFMLAWPYGYPQIYSGYRFTSYDEGPPLLPSGHTAPALNADASCRAPFTCFHRDPQVKVALAFRNLAAGAFRAVHVGYDRSLVAFARESSDGTVPSWAIFHFGSREAQTRVPEGIPGGRWRDLLSGKTFSLHPGTPLRLPARSAHLFVRAE